MRYGKWVVAAGALLALVLALLSIDREPAGPSVADAAESWRSEPVAPGEAALVLPTPQGRGCGQVATGLAALQDRAWVSYACFTGAGDESAPQPDPATAVGELRPDGQVERLELPADTIAPITVQDVSPDGTLWALQQGVVLSRTPGDDWRSIDTAPATSDIRDDVIDLDVLDNGALYLARRTSITLVRPGAPTVTLAADPERSETTSTYYADEAVTRPRPAEGARLPTLTGLTVLPDGTVVALATDSVLTLDAQGVLRTVVTPRSSGDDPTTRLFRTAVRDGGTGSYLSEALPDGGGVLVYDQRAGRILRIGLDGSIALVAGRPANSIGGPEDGDVSGTDWGPGGDRALGLDEVRLGIGGTFESSVGMAMLADGQLLATTSSGGVVRLSLP
jgi:hypothetical protein